MAAATFVVCAVPPATNVSPGPVGYALVLAVFTVLALWLLGRRAVASPFSRLEVGALAGLFGWIALGVLRAGGEWDAALVTTLLALLALACPWALARGVTVRRLTTTVMAMCGAAVLGSAVAAWVVPIVTGLGWHLRPGLPIGGASNNAVGLMIALAGTLAGAKRWPEHRWAWRCVALLAVVLVLQSVSRAGWVMVIVVLLAAAALHRQWSWQRVGVVTVPVAVVALLALVGLRGPSALIDTARIDNAAVALDAWSSSLGSIVAGLGPMQFWPWLAAERDGVGPSLQHETKWGDTLYHAHSTYLGVLVEHGLVGFVALVLVLALVVRRCIREIRARGDLALVAVALLVSLPAMLVELYLFRSFVSAFLWWAAVMAVGRNGSHDVADGTHADESAPRAEERDGPGRPQAGREHLDAEAQEADRAHGPRQVQQLAD